MKPDIEFLPNNNHIESDTHVVSRRELTDERWNELFFFYKQWSMDDFVLQNISKNEIEAL